MKNDYTLSRIPCIMITSKVKESDKNPAFENGVDDYLAKPFRVSDLVAGIDCLIEKSKRDIHLD